MKAQKSVFGKIVQVDGKFLFEDRDWETTPNF